MRILFVTWDGPQVSYLEGLFLPIFERLRPHGYEFAVLQFTWGKADGQPAQSACAAAGVPYRSVEVWRAGALGAFATAVAGSRTVDRVVRDWKIDALMPRSLQPALSALLSRSAKGLPIIFDADGLPADERVEFGGLTRTGPVYRALRAIERRAVQRSQVVLARTQAAVSILRERGGRGLDASKFYVVTNGRDPGPFLAAPIIRANDATRFCYIGSIGPQYETAEMLQLAQALLAAFPNATLQLFTGAPDAAAGILAEAGLSGATWINLRSLQQPEIPSALASCDVGFALRRPSVSMSAVAPIKLGDYLLAGVPIIGAAGIGPVEDVIRSGCMIPADKPIPEIVDWVGAVLADRENWRARCQEVGVRCFSIDRSVEDYLRALHSISEATATRTRIPARLET